jgi:N-methylhydantoinase B
VREYELLAPKATLTFRTDRRDHPPYGLDGGEPGAPSSNIVVSGGEPRELPTMPMHAFALRQGDRFTHASAGGGGFGDPYEREPAAVLADVLDGKVTVAAAREQYGVVLEDGRIDTTATLELRESR